MKIANLIFLLLLLLTPAVIQAQKEGAVWPVGEGKQVNFQSGSFEFTDFTGNPNTKASICDKEGNLVLYTNGRTVWNSNHEIVLNGEKLIPDNIFQNNKPIFVPYPKKEGWYILFYEEDDYKIILGQYNNALYYAEINANANNGKGEVVRQKIKIHDNFHSGPSIAGFCNNSYYWLVNDRNDNTVIDERTDRIYFYKIDENGVNPVPVINGHFMIGNSGNYRFSPNGDKLSFFIAGGYPFGNVISDFNFKTGELYNHRFIDDDLWSKEFSPDSRLFYYFSGQYLLQIDVGYTDNNTIKQSIDTILTLTQNKDVPYPGQEIRLAPDGKLYIHYIDAITRKNKLGRINKPNLKGSACEPELNLSDIDFYNFKFPDFVTSFFRDKTPEMIDEVFPDAGPDVVMCSNSVVKIGRGEKENTFYSWSPSLYVNDPFLPQTIFSPQEFYGSPKKIEYILRATDGNCWLNFDATQITVNPIPRKLPIEGSWSVCPFVEEVEYWTEKDGNKLQWLVDGGEIESGPSTERVKITWGETNPTASASVFSTNSYGCSSDTSVFPVRINVQLITETPKGPAKICIAESTNVEYQIRNTNGSVYEWFPDAGEVVSGQGTNKVAVKWHGAGQHKISVEETSVSIDTICFGESVPLFVEIINDSLEIELQNVSYNLQNNLEISYISEKLQNHKHSLYLRKQNESGGASEITISDLYDGDFTVAPTSNTFNSEIINLKVTNSCAEIFLSNKLQTIVLKGFNDDFKNQIRLNWNINQFWGNDKLEHEIWHSTNGTDGWKMIEKVASETEFIFQIKELSLTHFFRINEINRDKNIESWSNTIKIEVKDDLMIPDVFTPNGDGINDAWEIKNIYFHPFQEAVVYNRFGEKVYECKNEFIPWNGKINGEIFQGTYFYQITFDAQNIRYGQVTILQ